MNRQRLIAAALVSLVAWGIGSSAWASPLDDRIAAFEDASSTQTEPQVTQLLKVGVDENRSAKALAAVQVWLNRNHIESPAALFYAGTTAKRSGQWSSAIGYYQRLLTMAKPDRKLAGQAADAVYRLLLGPIDDDNAAYAFMRKDGNAIRQFGKARRYDRWFVNQAKRRRDLVALADRLAAITADKSVPNSRYEPDMDWLCAELEEYREADAGAYNAALALAQTKDVPGDVAARLRWVVTVMRYNFKLDELRADNAPVDASLTDDAMAIAAQLIKQSPNHGPMVVARGWGAEYGPSHRDHHVRRFNVHRERKLKHLLAAVPGMSPDKRDDLLALRLASGRVRFDLLDVYDLLAKDPNMLNRLDVADVKLFDRDVLTVEQANRLAPMLARNPHPDAAMIRAIAHSGSLELGDIAPEMFKSNEVWRFDDAKTAIDWARRASTTAEANIKQLRKQYNSLGKRYEQLQRMVNTKANEKDRRAAFNVLRKDLLAKSPSIPGALSLWDQLFTNAPDKDLAYMIKTLVADTSGQQGVLLRRGLAKAGFGKKRRGRMPWQATVHGNQFRYHRKPVQDAAPDLIAHLQNMVQRQAKAGSIDPMVFGMWLHTVNPGDKPARQLIKQLAASPAYAKLAPAYRTAAADPHHFGHIAMTPEMGQTDPHHVSRELLELADDAAPKAVEAALQAVLKRAASAPEPVTVIGLEPVAAMPQWNDNVLKLVLSLFGDNAPIGSYPSRQGYEPLVERLADELRQQERWSMLEPYLSGVWLAANARDHHAYAGVPRLIRFAESAIEADQLSVAMSVARTGLASEAGRTLQNSDNQTYQQWAGRLDQVHGKAAIALGIIDIPVDSRDPAYPIYKSQADFAIGNTGSAWDLYDKNADQLQPILRQLTVPYCLWVLERDIESRRSDRAQPLIRELTIWSRQEPATFSPQQEAELKIAYADTAFQEGKLQTAKAWYRRVADAQQYKNTPLQYEAILKSIDVDRAARDFDTAMAELDKLMAIRDEDLRVRVHYARGQVLFDQKKFAEAFDEVSTVLKREPNHADALILLGKAQLEMRKLVDASEIELGISQDQKIIVPGEMIKINLTDPALNISGVGADIEVEIWTKSGDRERVKLHQLGDDKSRFRAQVPSELGPRTPGDKVLQVLGRDEIRYGYSKRFRQKMTDLPPDPDVVIRIASDAHMATSAGAFPPREGERRLNLDELGVSTAQQALGRSRVRPGNPVYVRVTDADQSRTDQVDKIIVSLEARTGDVIPRLTLTETGKHTGEFQAQVPTAKAQALAYASESAPGRDANMVISAKPYPGWSGKVGSKEAIRYFVVDLNDNVPVDDMTIRCSDPSQALTGFVLQTSLDGTQWTSHARYPAAQAPPNGRPRITAFPTYGRALAVSKPTDRTVPEDWVTKMDIASARSHVPYGEFHVPNITSLDLDLPSGGHPGYSVIIRYRAFFYQPAAAIRTFKLTGLPGEATRLLIDGQSASPDADDPMTITRQLQPGLHTIEIWAHESRNELVKRKPTLLQNVDGHDELMPCPDSMFDPATFPKVARDTIPGPAAIERSADEPRLLHVSFGNNTRARLVRLAIVEHQGPAPAIDKITLTDTDDIERLPVATDYQQLRANDQLEVVPGDIITVRYEDDQAATPNRTVHQRRLSVAYNTATIIATFMNYEQTDEGRELITEPIRRFELDGDKGIGILINDPDMDQTPDRDRISLIIQTDDGKPEVVDALETGPHTGEFIRTIVPVSSAPTDTAQITVAPGSTITARYRDEENLDPGIPTDRVVVIEHALFSTPAMAVYDMTSTPLPDMDQQSEDGQSEDEQQSERGPEIVAPRRTIDYVTADTSADTAQPTQLIVGSSLRFDVIASHLALAPSSEIAAYVQTSSGRAMPRPEGQAAPPSDMPFDIRVPGTLRLVAKPTRSAPTITPAGYEPGSPAAPETSRPALDQGRFSFTVPVVLGDVPSRSYATDNAQLLSASQVPDALAVRPGDEIFIGFAFVDPQGQPQWLTARTTLTSHAMLDVMNSRYRRNLHAAYVGEKLYIRLIAPHLDVSPGRDIANVQLRTQSGVTVEHQLAETEVHSGIFKGSFSLGYQDQPLGETLPSVTLHGLPVKYGDQITVSFRDESVELPTPAMVLVNKGADGAVEPFSKRYGDDSVAIQTTFTLAECFFELAKYHRQMQQESLARREMGHAQKLLAEAIAAHQDDSLKAHAEYLLGNLAQEYADLSRNEESKKMMYHDALARFTTIPLDYPDTEFAPKAQFKKGLVYEKLGEVEVAVEEYVKLAYKYPEHELIPSVMSRLGAHFQAKGKQHKDKAEALEKQEGDVESQGQAIRERELARKEYLSAAQVFKKLFERFPNNPLAGLAGLRSSQNFMRAGDFAIAIDGFIKVADNEQFDDRKIRAQALFWAGISYERLDDLREAYETYRRVTFDFPDSVWAKQARGRLADPAFARIIEIENLERERMMESLKEQRK